MRKSIILFLALTLIGSASALAQGRKGLRINEVMVQNDSNYVDDYGRHEAWVELFNSTFAPMDIASIYLTTDSTQPKMYPVPLGDVKTEIPPRQHVVFWADGQPDKGTFHVSFRLKPGQDNWIGVYDANGHTIIDSITVPASLTSDQSYARINDGLDGWEVRDGITKFVTPSSANRVVDSNSKVEMFAETDGHGFGMSLMAMIIVFFALALLCVCFYIVGMIGARVSQRNKAESHGKDVRTLPREEQPAHDSGEEIAAIVMALNEHLNAHDRESTILTINKVRRSYSPWSSKIYNMRELPRR